MHHLLVPIWIQRSPAVWSNKALHSLVPLFPVGPRGSFVILEFNLAKERLSRAANVEHNRDTDHRIMYGVQKLSMGVVEQKHVCWSDTFNAKW